MNQLNNNKMKKLSGDQILEIVQEKLEVYDWGHHDFDKEDIGLGEVIQIEQVGGEDQGTTWYSIKHFVDHDVYIKVEGYYTSYDGVDFDYGYGTVVRPVEKTITVFE